MENKYYRYIDMKNGYIKRKTDIKICDCEWIDEMIHIQNTEFSNAY